MKILLFHGYLLRGTGSNVYNAQLAQALAHAGAEVHLLAQEHRAADLDFVDAVGGWDEHERLKVQALRSPICCTVYRPDIGGLLPVYVHDRYDGFEVKTFLDCSDEELDAYIDANVKAVRDVVELVQPDLALANHLVMGPAILARALGERVPYAVKIHGSALEYVVKRDPDRFMPYAREGLAGARGVLVGSRHTAESLWEAMDDPALPDRTRLGPPGVDIAEFRPRDGEQGIRELARTMHAKEAEEQTGGAFDRDIHAAAAALDRLDPGEDRLVAYVGKLIVSKGVDLLAAAWPLVLQRAPDARLVVVGFGAYREGFERLLAALAAGDLDEVRRIAEAGRELEGGPRQPLAHLLAFLDTVDDAYVEAASRMADRAVVVGRLEHAELVGLLPACEAQVVPSTFPEAFGMVAAEAAACGVLPVSAAHSGLAEVTAQLREVVPAEVAPLLSFEVGDGAVRELAEDLIGWLEAGDDLRERTRAALVEIARERFSWEGVARGVIAAAEGRLDALSPPIPDRL